MSDKCGNCGSTDLGSVSKDLWHYSRKCNNCGATTTYRSNGNIYDVSGGSLSKKSERLLSDNEMENLRRKSIGIDIERALGKWNYKHGWGDKK
jgi:hypothetical protein